MQEPTSYLELEAACVLWEAVNDLTATGAAEHVAESDRAACLAIDTARRSFGTSALRRACCLHAKHLSDTWHAMPTGCRDAISFDWDFAPAYALRCLDWSGMAERGDYPTAPTVDAAAAILLPMLEHRDNFESAQALQCAT